MRPLHFFIAISAALIINSVGLGLIYLRFNNLSQAMENISVPNPTSTTNTNQEILDKLTEIQNQLFASQNQASTNQVLGNSSSQSNLSEILPDLYPTPISNIPNSTNSISKSNITISESKYSPVKVYKDSNESSAVIATISYGQKYPYTTKLNNWYLISLPSGNLGWVSSQVVIETQ